MNTQMHTILYTKENTMDYKEKGMKVLKEDLEKQGASKHDIAVTLAFNDTALDNIVTFINELDNPVLAKTSLRVLSTLMMLTASAVILYGNEGDTNNDNNNRK